MPQNQRTKISSYRREDQASTGHGLIADGIVSQVTVDCDERALYTLHGAAGRHTTAPASRVHRQLYFAPVDGQREKGQKSMAPPFV